MEPKTARRRPPPVAPHGGSGPADCGPRQPAIGHVGPMGCRRACARRPRPDLRRRAWHTRRNVDARPGRRERVRRRGGACVRAWHERLARRDRTIVPAPSRRSRPATRVSEPLPVARPLGRDRPAPSASVGADGAATRSRGRSACVSAAVSAGCRAHRLASRSPGTEWRDGACAAPRPARLAVSARPSLRPDRVGSADPALHPLARRAETAPGEGRHATTFAGGPEPAARHDARPDAARLVARRRFRPERHRPGRRPGPNRDGRRW